jgi:hypothetical protein
MIEPGDVRVIMPRTSELPARRYDPVIVGKGLPTYTDVRASEIFLQWSSS